MTGQTLTQQLDDATARTVLEDAALVRANENMISRYVAAKRLQWRPSTVRLRELQLRAIARALAPTALIDVTEDQVLTWHEQLTGGPETVSSYISTIRGFYRWLAVKARPRVRTDDPTILLERPKVRRGQPRPVLRRDYQLALACALSQPEIYAWLGLMGCCGLRCCEVAWLRTLDVEDCSIDDDGTGLLHVTGKGGHQRTVPAGSDLMMVLRPFVQLHGGGPLFVRPSGGPYTPDQISARMGRFLREIGIDATAHQLRHTFGTGYHELDVDLFRQAQLMGHSSVQTTAIYTALSPTEAARHVEQLTRQQLGETSGYAAGARGPSPLRAQTRRRGAGVS